jgi:argininosuccinate lyase
LGTQHVYLATFTIDEARALDALSDRSVCACELAERVMTGTGIDFRTAHGVVGRLVRMLDENGRTLSDVTLGDLSDALRAAGAPTTGVTQQLLALALDPKACVAARTDVGGAAPEEVAAMAEELTAAAGERRHAIDAARARRKCALDRLHAEATAFARGEK